jgi:hypothetical protein
MFSDDVLLFLILRLEEARLHPRETRKNDDENASLMRFSSPPIFADPREPHFSRVSAFVKLLMCSAVGREFFKEHFLSLAYHS